MISSGDECKLCLDVHAYQVHFKNWSRVPGLGSILSLAFNTNHLQWGPFPGIAWL